MKKELWMIPLALTFALSTPSVNNSECIDTPDSSWNRNDFDPQAYSCKTETGHIIYMRDGKEFFTEEDYDSFSLGIELKEGIMVHTQNDNTYRGFLYNPEDGSLKQEYCVIAYAPYYYC